MATTLPAHPSISPRNAPIILCILDGVGIGLGEEDDGPQTSIMPTFNRWLAEHPNRTLRAHGVAVGLPSDGDMGNSEVGHNAMGAGRVFDQGAKLVDHAIATGAAFETAVWTSLTQGTTLHLIGLVSDGNVHSHVDHLNALIDRAHSDGVATVRVHVLTDGRDVEPRTALNWVAPLEAHLAELSDGDHDYAIASGGGRMHMTMDRYEADWPMVKRGWDAHVHGVGQAFGSATEAIQALYSADPEVDDQYLPAFVITRHGDPCGPIRDGDSVLFFNFRGDRGIEISRAFEEPDLDTFDRGTVPNVTYAGMMQYDGDAKIPRTYLVQPPSIDKVVGEYLAAAGKRTFACSETQKFGHVTFFFNGNRSGKIDEALEHYLEIPSDNVSFDERPWMKCAEIAEAAIDAIEQGFDHIRINIANGDMVGHTGNLDAVRVSLTAMDQQLARLEKAAAKAGAVMLVTADHGNCEEMYTRKKGKVVMDARGRPSPKTSHTLNAVPFIVIDPTGAVTVDPEGDRGIASIGATLLALCGLQPPEDYLPGLVRPA
ncbi:MAG: 2,3-bisphosphoglycerate-independent phosphoglycerate mutase [Myxococcota bacterium]